MIQTRKHQPTLSLARLIDRVGTPLVAAFCGLLAAYATLPFGLLPFGVAAACLYFDRTMLTVAPAIGAVIGYILQGTVGLPYIAGVLLALPLRFILTALIRRLSRQTVSMITAASSLLLTHLLICSYHGFLTFDILTGILSIAAGLCFTFFGCTALPASLQSGTRRTGLTQTEAAALLIVISILFLPLCQFSFYGIAPARIPAVFAVICFSVWGGTAMGGMSGAIVGTILSFAHEGTSHIIAAYAVGGTLAGLIGRKGRLRAVFVFLLGSTALSLYINGSLSALATLCESSLACGIYALLPEKGVATLGRLFTLRHNGKAGQADSVCAYVSHKLMTTARHLDRISHTLTPAETPVSPADLRYDLDHALEPLCRRCSRSTACRVGQSFDTEKIFSGLCRTLVNRPLTATDLPEHFKERCPSWSALLNTANTQGAAHRTAVLQNYEDDRNKTVLAAQYASLSQLLDEMGQQVGQPLRFDDTLTRRIEDYFAAKSCRVQTLTVYRDHHDGLYIRAVLRTRTAPGDRRTVADLSTLCGTNLSLLSCDPIGEDWHLLLGRRDKFKLEIASAQSNKTGESVCGDAFTHLSPRPYHQTVVLSDGMGSGMDAHRHATLTCEIFESILQSGFDTPKALRLLNSTLLLAGDTQTFSTLDVADIDRLTGRVDLYKLGAANTVILRGGRSYTIPCSSLPAGILSNAKPEHRFFTLKDGDVLILHSDGVELTDEILLALQKENDLHAMCNLCLKECGDAQDDCTVLCIRAKNR